MLTTHVKAGTLQCCPQSPLLAVLCYTPCSVSFRAFVFAVSQFTRSHAALLGSKGRHWKSHQFQFEALSLTFFFPQQSVPRAWALVVWWLTLLSRVSWYRDSFFCFTTDFLCPWESHLIYHSLNTTEKMMLFFLSKSIRRTILLPLRGECIALCHLDRQKNGTF